MARLENLVRDLRLSLRSLAASPVFALVAVVSLGVGIGAGTCVFSLVNAILLRPLPVPSSQELRVLQWSASNVRIPSYDGSSISLEGGGWSSAESVSHPAFLALRSQGATQADVFGFCPLHEAAVTAGGQPLVADGMLVSDNFFSGLQLRPQIGRLLQPGEDYGGGAMNVVIGYGWWQRYFDLDPGVIGRTVALNGVAFTIVGVLAPAFTGIEPGRRCDFYVPLSASSPFLYTAISADWHWFVRVMARLRPGAGDARLAAMLGTAFAAQTGAVVKGPKFQVEPGGAGLGYDREAYRRPLLLMLAVVGLVLLAASANLAGLLLARGTTRWHEMAVRAALGGGTWRLFQQSLTDSLAISLLGGGLGVLLATWGRAPLADLLARRAGALRYEFSLDPMVLAFSLAITVTAAVLAGLVPAWRACRADPVDALRSRGTIGNPRLRTGRLLVVVQVSLSVLVLAGAGLFVRTLVNLSRIDAGFDLQRLLVATVNIRGGADAHAEPARFYDRLQVEVARIPGVEAATIIEFPLLGPGGSSGSFSRFVDGPAPESPAMMQVRRLRVGETFFKTMGIPIVRGRELQPTDSAEAAKVVIVNESFVRSYQRDRDAVGLAFRMWEADWRIVGVCRDAKYSDIKEAVPPTAYFPYKQMFYSRFRDTHLRGASIAARTTLPPLALSAAVRQAVARVDPGVAVTAVTTQEDVRDRSIGRERLVAVLCSGLAGVALMLSWIGLFSLMAYNVGRRTGEIGIRMALGADRPDITRPILREALLLSGAGVALGVPLCLVFTRLVRNQLFGVTPGDPVSIGLAAIGLLVTAAASAWVPARRAQRVEPSDALRHDA